MNSSTDTPDGKAAKQPRKFMFDTKDFDRAREPEEKAPMFTEEQVLLARKEGYAQGRADGLKEARQQQEEKIAELAARVLAHAEKLLAAETARHTTSQAQTLDLVSRITAKLLPALARAVALDECFRSAGDALEQRKEEPRIAISVHDSLFVPFKTRLDELAASRGFAGKLIVLSDAQMQPTDCRVEWADGGAERNFERLYAAIDDEIRKSRETLSNSNGEKT